jgi:transcriptional regulator with XRE-family HTH domain
MCPARYPLVSAGEARSGDVRLLLGRELRALRTTRSIRLEDAARTLGIAASTLSRIENGRAPARVVFVSSLLTAYGLGEDSELVLRLSDLARAGQRVSWWYAYRALLSEDTKRYLDLEAAACSVLCYSAQAVPGLAQTPEYAAAAVAASRPGLTAGQIRAAAAASANRITLARRSTALGLHLMVDESALHRPVGGAAVQAGQLRYLAECAAEPGTRLQVLGLSGERQPLSPAITVLKFGPDEPDPAVTAGVAGQAIILRRRQDRAAARQVLASLAAAALPPADSVILIRKIAAQFGSQG